MKKLMLILSVAVVSAVSFVGCRSTSCCCADRSAEGHCAAVCKCGGECGCGGGCRCGSRDPVVSPDKTSDAQSAEGVPQLPKVTPWWRD